jgi:hypothetical protein
MSDPPGQATFRNHGYEGHEMKRPKQLPAVDRNSNRCASVPMGANVGPSGWFDDVVNTVRNVASTVQHVAPVAQSIFSAL